MSDDPILDPMNHKDWEEWAREASMDGEFLKPDHDEFQLPSSPKESLLAHIDPGADGDEVTKVMQVHLREWYDEIERLCLLSLALNRKLVLAESALENIVALTGRHDLPDAQVIAIRALERDRTPVLTQPTPSSATE